METEDLYIISIYRSNDGLLSTLVQENLNTSKSTVVIGDMTNSNQKKPANELRDYLKHKKFKQIIKKATHLDGGHIKTNLHL